MNYRTLVICLFSLMTFLPTAFSQFNIKVGYRAIRSEIEDLNKTIIASYDQERMFLEQKLENIHMMSGLDLGLRYRIRNIGIELSWSSVSAETEAFGTSGTGVIVEKNLQSRMREWSLSLENYFGNFGIGASIDQRNLRFLTKLENFDRQREISSDGGYASKFFVLFHIPSENVGLTIKPFVQYPWDNLSILGVADDLAPDLNLSEDQALFDDYVFGISFVIYNGPQN